MLRNRRRPSQFFLQFPVEAFQQPFAGIHKTSGEIQLSQGRLLAPNEEQHFFPRLDYAACGGGGIVVIYKTAVGAVEFIPCKPDIPGSAGWTILKHNSDDYRINAMICKCALKVRTYECDSYGHVNNANYLNYLEYARYELLRDTGFDYSAMIKAGYGVYVARIEIDYKRPAVADDELLVKSWPIKKGAVSGVIVQEIWRGDELIVAAKVTWAFVDSKGMPTKVPPRWDVPGLRP